MFGRGDTIGCLLLLFSDSPDHFVGHPASPDYLLVDLSPDYLVVEDVSADYMESTSLTLLVSGCPDHFPFLHLLRLAVDVYLHGRDIHLKNQHIMREALPHQISENSKRLSPPPK